MSTYEDASAASEELNAALSQTRAQMYAHFNVMMAGEETFETYIDFLSAISEALGRFGFKAMPQVAQAAPVVGRSQ